MAITQRHAQLLLDGRPPSRPPRTNTVQGSARLLEERELLDRFFGLHGGRG